MKKMLMTATVPSMIGQFNMGNIDILLKMGYEVHVACNFRDYSYWPKERIKEFVEELNRLGVKNYHIEYSRSPSSIGKMLKSFQQLDRLLKAEDFGFVHCHTPMAGVVSRVCCHRNKVKVIYTAHGFHFYEGASVQNWLLYYPIEKLLSRWTDILITINREDYKRAKNKFRARKSVYIPGVGVDTKKYATCSVTKEEKRQEFGIPMDAFVLLSVGELNRNKNHEVVIRALAKLKNCKIHYVVAGKGELLGYLRKLSDELGVWDQVHLLEYREDVSQIYQIADVYVLPSIREGLNVSLMEAMASGLPCVVSKIRGNVDLIIEGAGGIHCAVDEVESFASAIEKMFCEGTFREECGINNAVKVQEFDIDKTDTKMQEIYRGGTAFYVDCCSEKRKGKKSDFIKMILL